MKLEQSFEVAAPLDRVWAALIDVERVAPCLPGASIASRNDDGSYDGTFDVKIGPTSASYAGKLQMENIDDEAHTATMQAAGTDKRGQGGAKATIVFSVSEAGANATKVDLASDYHITGRLARFGRGGMIEEISNRLIGEFAESLQQLLAADTKGAAGPAPVTAAPVVEVDGASADADAPGAPGAAAAEVVPAVASAASVAAEDPVVSAEDPVAEDPVASAEDPVTPAPAVTEPVASAEDPPAPTGAPEAIGTAEVLGTDEPAAAIPAGISEAPSSALAAPRALNQAPPPENEPAHGLSLVASALWSQAKRNPIPLISALIGFLLALRVFRRRG
jgi:uncharacterized protein